jgi:hypothetical protein
MKFLGLLNAPSGLTRFRWQGHVLLWLAVCAPTYAAAQVVFSRSTPPLPSFSVGDLRALQTPLGPVLVEGDAVMNGLFVFGRDGGRIAAEQSLGPVVSIDARGTLIAAATPTTSDVRLYWVGEQDAGLTQAGRVITPTPSLVALSLRPTGPELFVSSGAILRRYDLKADGGLFVAALKTNFDFKQIPFSFAIDDRDGTLYFTTALGIYALAEDAAAASVVDLVATGQLGGSPSGVALYPFDASGVVLAVAVPDNPSKVAIYRDGNFQGRFTVVSDAGAPVFSIQRLSIATAFSEFPSGLLTVSDAQSGNHKLVDWESVSASQTPPLPVTRLDAGALTDGGRLDSGVRDGGLRDAGMNGSGGGIGAGGFPTGGNGNRGGGPSTSEDPRPCGCSTSPLFLMLSASLYFRFRSRPFSQQRQLEF